MTDRGGGRKYRNEYDINRIWRQRSDCERIKYFPSRFVKKSVFFNTPNDFVLKWESAPWSLSFNNYQLRRYRAPENCNIDIKLHHNERSVDHFELADLFYLYKCYWCYIHFPRFHELTNIVTLNMTVFLPCIYNYRALKYWFTYQDGCQMELWTYCLSIMYINVIISKLILR